MYLNWLYKVFSQITKNTTQNEMNPSFKKMQLNLVSVTVFLKSVGLSSKRVGHQGVSTDD